MVKYYKYLSFILLNYSQNLIQFSIQGPADRQVYVSMAIDVSNLNPPVIDVCISTYEW